MVTALVVLAALLHATWNAIGKAIPDPLVSSGLIGCAYSVIGCAACLVLPLPDRAAWPFLGVSVVLQSLYLLMLMTSYQGADLGRVYPVARGISPLLVLLISIAVLDEDLRWAQLLGISIVCSSLGVLVLAGGRPRKGDGVGLAVLTGAVIASYTVVDGLGVRQTDHVLSYAMWLFLLQGPVIPLIGLRRRRRGYVVQLRRYLAVGLLGGVLSLASYTIVVWAQSRAAIAEVAALRETSIIFAAVIGAAVFKERLGLVGLTAVVTTVGGIVLLQLS